MQCNLFDIRQTVIIICLFYFDLFISYFIIDFTNFLDQPLRRRY